MKSLKFLWPFVERLITVSALLATVYFTYLSNETNQKTFESNKEFWNIQNRPMLTFEGSLKAIPGGQKEILFLKNIGSFPSQDTRINLKRFCDGELKDDVLSLDIIDAELLFQEAQRRIRKFEVKKDTLSKIADSGRIATEVYQDLLFELKKRARKRPEIKKFINTDEILSERIIFPNEKIDYLIELPSRNCETVTLRFEVKYKKFKSLQEFVTIRILEKLMPKGDWVILETQGS